MADDFGSNLLGTNPIFGNVQGTSPVAPTQNAGGNGLGALLSLVNPSAQPAPAPVAQPQQGMDKQKLMNLISMVGMIGGAISPKDSWAGKLGGVASQMASQNLFADAQLAKDKEHRKFLTEALKYYHPSIVSSLMSQPASSTAGYFTNAVTPAGQPGYPAPVVGGLTNG